MVRLFEYILLIFALPIIFFKSDLFGENLKSKHKILKSIFFKYYLSTKFLKFKKRIKLGDIHRKDINLNKFLKTNKIKDISINNTPHFNYNNLQWSEEQKKMKKEILEGNYKEGWNTSISISRDNIVTDGNHRLCILKEKYGEDYKIWVDKNYGWSWEKLAKTNLLVTYWLVTKNPNTPILKNNNVNFANNIITEFKSKGVTQFQNENGELSNEGCELLIEYWNILFPKNKINFDE